MSGDAYCFAGVLLSLATLGFITFLILKTPRPVIFTTWKDILAAARETQTLFEKLLLVLVLVRQLSRSTAILLTLGVIPAATSIGTSLCGISPETLRGIRDIINDVLRRLGSDQKAASCMEFRIALR